jgi:hypothetical protein
MFYKYITIGITHVLPGGVDHILFIISLFFLSPTLKAIIKQSLVFTVAHCITLLLGAFSIIPNWPDIIEPFIAFTILSTALLNLYTNKSNISSYKYVMPFLFGLIHGLGFASALREIGIPKSEFVFALLSFNIGVEIAQIMIIGSLFYLVFKPFSNKAYYSNLIVYPINVIIAIVALYMFIERIAII